MSRFALFDPRTNYLEWIGDAADVGAALAAARADRSDLTGDVLVYEVSAEESTRLEDWWRSGAKADEFPALVNVGATHRI